jgi:hypothetical protein
MIEFSTNRWIAGIISLNSENPAVLTNKSPLFYASTLHPNLFFP